MWRSHGPFPCGGAEYSNRFRSLPNGSVIGNLRSSGPLDRIPLPELTTKRVDISESGSEFAVDCGNVGGSNDHWLLCLRRFGRKSFGRDKPPFSDAAQLVLTIRELLQAESSICDLAWHYPEE